MTENTHIPSRDDPASEREIRLPETSSAQQFSGERYLPSLSGEMELEHIHRYIAATTLCRDKDVLDIACGEGYGTYILSQAANSVCGVDIDPGTVRLAEAKYIRDNISFKQGSCAQIPCADASFDVLVSFETLEHFKEHEAFFSEAKRVLRPGGLLIISTPDKVFYNQQRTETNHYHVRELTREEFLSTLQSSFQNVTIAGQRTLFASAIISDPSGQKDGDFSFASAASGDAVKLSKTVPECPYLIALCSDAPISGALNGLFEGKLQPNLLSALEGGIAERDAAIVSLRAEACAKEGELNRAAEDRGQLKKEISEREVQIEKANDEIAALSRHISNIRKSQLDLSRRSFAFESQLRDERVKSKRLAASLGSNGALQPRRNRLWRAISDRLKTIYRYAPRLLAKKPAQLLSLIRDALVLDGSRLFDAGYYLRCYPDVAASGVDPLLHFLCDGAAELRSPHPLFDAAFYRSQVPELDPRRTNLLAHYIQSGGTRGLFPSPLFDGAFYLRTYADIKTARANPLIHYLENGAAEGRVPHLLFDTSYYERCHLDVLDSGQNPLVHFALHGAFEGRNPHPLFDNVFYRKQAGTDLKGGENPLIHYLLKGARQGLDPSPLFDTRFYIGRFPDLWRNQPTNPLMHYLTVGAHKGIDPCPLFDSQYYLSSNPDLAKAGVSPLLHFSEFGAREIRNPSPLFDCSFYYQAYSDVLAAGVNALGHYMEYGRAESRRYNMAGMQSTAMQIAEILKATHIEQGLAPYISGISLNQDCAPEVSIIVPVHNNAHFTARCLKSIAQYTRDVNYEVILVDDLSIDETTHIFDKVPGLRIVRNQVNQGFIRSCNEGARLARGKYVLFLNNDTCVMPGWLDTLIETFRQYPDAGLVGSKLLYPGGRLQEAGGIIWPDASGWNYGNRKHPEHFEFNYVRDVDYCSGACIILPIETWRKAGGFDELFLPAYYEDCDLAFKVRAGGQRVLYQPFSMVVHFEGASSGTDISAGVKKHQVLNQPKFRERWGAALSTYTPETDSKRRYLSRPDKGRILIIDAATPTPDRDAGSEVLFNYIRIFRSMHYGISFIPSSNMLHYGRYTEMLQQAGVECVYAPFCTSVKEYLKAHGAEFDLVIVYRAAVANEHLEDVRNFAPHAKVVFNTVDLHFLRMEREAELRQTDTAFKQAAKMREVELGLMEKVDTTIILSQREYELVRQLKPHAKTVWISLARDIPGCLAPYQSRRGAVFVGGFRHPPNVDGVLWLLHDIWPRVRKLMPEATLTIIGGDAPQQVQDISGRAGVTVAGYIPSLDGIFSSCLVNVAPLRYGAGVKGKIVTSLSYGVPTVATAVATEGMGLVPDKHVLVADDPDAFADSIVRAMRSRHLWESLSLDGLQFAEANFSVNSVAQRIKTMLGDLGLPL